MTEYKPKLIEVALPLAAINAEASREKSIRHGHPSTLHLWWARRPLAAARAVIWASLVDDPSGDPSLSEEEQTAERDRLFDVLKRLVKWENSNNPDVLAEAKAEIDRCFPDGPPPILDPFGGGGAIPLEAQRLGLRALSGDLNPVAVLIQKAMIEIPPRFASMPPVNPDLDHELNTWERAQGLAADLEKYGEAMRDRALQKVGHLYPPLVGAEGQPLTAVAWIWVRTIESPDPTWEGHVPLAPNWVLRKGRNKQTVWVKPTVDLDSQKIRYSIQEGGSPLEGTLKRGNAFCIATGAAITAQYIKEQGVSGKLRNELVAVIAQDPIRGRVYCGPDNSQALGYGDALDSEIGGPAGTMSTHPQYMATPRYGFTEWKDLFLPRQMMVLLSMVEQLTEMSSRIETDALDAGMERGQHLRNGGSGALAYAEAVVTYLAMNIDRCASRWNHLAVWHSGRETLEHIFRLNAFQMTWVHAEGNPFSDSTGNWMGQLRWMKKAIERLPASAEGEVRQEEATARVEGAPGALICTDPPYYDNIPYSDLSDFFYSWLKLAISDIWPAEFSTLQTPKADELVADYQRLGSRVAAEEFFEDRMSSFMVSVSKSQSLEAPASIFYAYKATESREGESVSTGWDTFLQAIIDAGMVITATWPVRTEMPGGQRMSGRNVLSSSVVLTCRPLGHKAALATRSQFVDELRAVLPGALATLQAGSIAPVDLPQSAIGPGIGVFSRHLGVIEADGSRMPVRRALQLINDEVDQALGGVEAELDAASRFALTWYSQFCFSDGPFGDADNLARAKNTSVEAVLDAGVAALTGSRLGLVSRADLPAGWSPLTDRRLTVWEATQHMVAALGRSESEAASLMADLGGYADRARQLAYVLFARATDAGWADEAGVYNGLITAWPELVSLAANPRGGSGQGELQLDS